MKCAGSTEHGFASVITGRIDDLDWIGEVPLFAAVVDLRIPGAPDGESLRRLRTRFPELPIFVASARSEIAVEVPITGRFTKPFVAAELIDRIETLYARRD